MDPVLRPLRVGIAHHIFRSFDRTDDLRLLHVLLRQSSIHLFIIPVIGTSPPPTFERATYTKQCIDAVENWVEYSIRSIGNRERWHARSAAGGEPVEAWLDIDDGPFRHVAGTPTLGPMALPAEEGSLAGAAFQMLVAKSLRCDLYITESPDLIDLDGESGYKYWTEAISPRAVVPLLGLYLRRLGRFRLDYDRRLGRHDQHDSYFSSGEESVIFFHTAVRGMLGETFEWRQLAGRAATPEDGQEFSLFADTVLHRLEQMLRERDHLMHQLAVAPNGIAAGYVGGDAFDTILLLSWAALDAAAEAVNAFFALGVKLPGWNSGAFLSKLKGRADWLALRFLSEKQGDDSFRLLKALSELRNSIHSEAISHLPKIFVVHDFAGRVLLPIPAMRFAKVRGHFCKMDGLDRWGIYEGVHGSARAYLHPGEFVETLTPRLFALVHRIMLDMLQAREDATDRSSKSRQGRPLSVDEQDALRLLGLERVNQRTS